METIKQDFIRFVKGSPLYFVCSVIYYFLASRTFGLPEGFILAGVFYVASLLLVFTPAGEKLLRFLERVRKIETKEEKAYLLPLFQEVYDQAKLINSKLEGIELCVIDKMAVNACAIGKHTIAVTKGAIETFSENELKALIAHEIAHIAYGDTIAKLYAVVGNGLFSFWVLILRAFLAIVDFVQTLYKRPGSERLVVIVLRLIVDFALFLIMFLMNAVVAINSRSNEFRADKYAFELGYGDSLLKAFYLLEKIVLGDNGSIIQRMTASHPRITARIEHLETLLDQEKPMQGNPWNLS